MSGEKDNEFSKITPKKVIKAAAIGTGVVGAALIAPIGIAGVIGLGLAGAATSWFTESIGDSINKNDRK